MKNTGKAGLTGVPGLGGSSAGMIPTPLEAAAYGRISSSAEVDEFLAALAATNPRLRCESWGHSLLGRPLRALVCASAVSPPRLRVMLVGSQHGAEPAGCEALMLTARTIVQGELGAALEGLEILILPNANPDGREADNRRNANGVNLNRDYVRLSQPESRALNSALLRYRPDVVLDAHESATLKRKTLWRQGYLTEFEAQFDTANHPAIPEGVRRFCEQGILKPWLERVAADGLPAQRYLKEILSVTQPLTHGGATLRNFRNKAGVLGSLSFLLETRLDPKDGTYESFRNISVRTAKQAQCVREFLLLLRERSDEIQTLVSSRPPLPPGAPLVLGADYVEAPGAPRVEVTLRRADDDERVVVEFRDHRTLRPRPPIKLPTAYIVTRHMGMVERLLLRHGLVWDVVTATREMRVVEQTVVDGMSDDKTVITTTRVTTLEVPDGALCIPTSQRHGEVVALLLEPSSTGSVFTLPEYRSLLRPGRPLFVYRAN